MKNTIKDIQKQVRSKKMKIGTKSAKLLKEMSKELKVPIKHLIKGAITNTKSRDKVTIKPEYVEQIKSLYLMLRQAPPITQFAETMGWKEFETKKRKLGTPHSCFDLQMEDWDAIAHHIAEDYKKYGKNFFEHYPNLSPKGLKGILKKMKKKGK